MAIYIPEDKLAEIRNTANITDIISERVVLKKAGKDHVGLCPFHSEKTPSFTVSAVKQIYHCFGCGAGGDVFSFLMKYDGIGFSEAVQSLARRYGIDLPERNMSASQRKVASQRQQLFDLNKQVMSYFISQLSGRSSGQKVRAYLEKRGFHQEIITQFGVGFAPDGWDNLVRFFRKLNVSQALAEKTGLVVPRKNTGLYDRFRNRVMFPIFDVSNQIIGFGGRVLDDSKPKYLNSPETPIYNKSRSLYGAHAAKNKSRETGSVYIVEGYFDLLALHQHGITNTVATLGTSLTAEHISALRRGFAQKAFLVFDSDEAGLKAARRSISLFMNAAMDAAVIVLPKGYDPDSFIFEFGREAFEKASETAIGMVEFLIESSIQSNGLSMEGKVRVISDLQQPLLEIKDSVARSIYIKYLAERLSVNETAIIEKIKSGEKRFKQAQPNNWLKHNDDKQSLSENDLLIESEMIRVEKQIVSMMLKSPEILPEIKKRRVLDYFSDKRLIEIAKIVLKHPIYGDEDLPGLMNHIESTDHKNMIASLVIDDECRDLNNCEQLLSQFINGIERRQSSLLSQIKSAQESNNDELLFELLRKKQEQLINR
ncbi:MAG: DNA primase [Desulfobacteraceae bacterium]|nr:DNA primase [Desulfobacteraceae bacterium]MBC2755937.1 DNA primase [Desulfobacteraceae bacterium]